MEGKVGIAVASGVASKVAELLFSPIQREIRYVFKCNGFVEKLRSQLVDLNNKKERLEVTVEKADRYGDKIFNDVNQCLTKMDEIIAREKNLVDEWKDKVKNKRCFIGLCPNLMSRHKLSKAAVNAAKDADDLLIKVNGLKLATTVSYTPAPEVPPDVTGLYQQFDSRMKVFNDVMEALEDSNVDMIGVYGMGGVGKTTLVLQAKKKVLDGKLFDSVVMAEVTQTPDLKRIQCEFASKLGITFDQPNNEFENARQLRQCLKEKRVLVILDNIWKKLELEAIGIPFGNDEKEAKDVQSRCKVLLTSRSEHVLHNVMNSQKNFRIEVLSNEEAVTLFWSTMNDLSAETSDFQRLADDIVRKCGGLPVAIKTIASALKSKPIEVWRNALNSLKNSDIGHIPGVKSEVYSAIKLSYDFLENDESKSLFRLCALQSDGSRILINDLMTYVMGSGWFKNVRRLKEARDKVHALINNLQSSCLLLDGDNECVKMHDIIHAVGVSIAAEGRMINIQNVQDLKEELENVIPKDPIPKDPVAISVTCGDIQKPPQKMECPELNLFLFFANYGSSLQIHSPFFEGMKKLRVLNLTRIVFPPSLFCLSNLRTLSLINCRSVVDVALVGDLENLQILSFRGSDIEQLPLKIGQLTQLKKLDLTNCLRLKVIAPNVISKLSQLEELYVLHSFTKWEKGLGGSNASLVELNALTQLNTLEINIPDVKIVPPDLVSQELERFKIFLGDEWQWQWEWLDWYIKPKTLRTLKFKGLVKSSHFDQGMKTLLKRAEELYLDELIGFHHFHELDDGEGFPQLKYLTLKNTPRRLSGTSSASKEIVAENYPQDFITVLFNNKVTFPILEMLNLSSLDSQKIWPDQFSTCQNLTELEVTDCRYLKFLFSYSMVCSLVVLQNLVIKNCESMECVINTGIDEEQMIGVKIFSKLKSLVLSGLPNLTRFVCMNSSEEQSLFNEKVTLPILETLTLSELNIEKIWLEQVSLCENLTKLYVKRCFHLKFLFPYSMVRSLVQLQYLEIMSCKSMECVINASDEEQIIGVMVLPKLKTLEIISCKSMECVINASDEEQIIGVMVLPKLKTLKLRILPNLTRFVFTNSSDTQSLFNEKVGLPDLEILEIDQMSNLRKIWHHHLHSDYFDKLKQLKVCHCDKLMNIFSSNIILGRRFQRLEKVEVGGCKVIKEIIEEETSSNRMVDEEFPIANTSIGSTSESKVFPQLTSMKLEWLPDLKSIYQGVHMLKWPALKDLLVTSCEKVEILIDNHKVAFPNLYKLDVQCCNELKNLMTISTFESPEKLERISISHCNMIEEIIQVREVKVDHVVFSQLECLKLHNLVRLKHFFGGNSTIEFPYLRQMVVSGCLNMKIFSRGVLLTPELQKVQLIDNYRQEKEERWEGSLNSTVQKMFEEMAGIYGLDHLILSQGTRVKEIWYDQTIPVNAFSNLTMLVVDDCKLMLSAIPANRLRFLKNLDILKVKNCDSVEEVVHIEELNTDEHSEQLFPKLRFLDLIDLPKLKRFCNFSGNIIKLAHVWFLTIENCPNVETFISNSSHAQPLFNEKVALHKLEYLQLSKLPKLLHLCKENSGSIDAFQILRSLIILECCNLEQVVPSCVSFLNLDNMKISKCDGLINLVALSTAKSLVNLRQLEVNDCQMIEEIIHAGEEVKNGEEVKKDCIVFSKLQYLELSCLPHLVGFFLGNYTLEFSCLKKVIVKECPKMEIFSRGILSTPKLEGVEIVKKDERLWEGSLNSTIQKLFDEKNMQSSKGEDE